MNRPQDAVQKYQEKIRALQQIAVWLQGRADEIRKATESVENEAHRSALRERPVIVSAPEALWWEDSREFGGVYDVWGHFAFQGNGDENLERVREWVGRLRLELQRQQAWRERVNDWANKIESSPANKETLKAAVNAYCQQVQGLLSALRAVPKPDFNGSEAPAVTWQRYERRLQEVFGEEIRKVKDRRTPLDPYRIRKMVPSGLSPLQMPVEPSGPTGMSPMGYKLLEIKNQLNSRTQDLETARAVLSQSEVDLRAIAPAMSPTDLVARRARIDWAAAAVKDWENWHRLREEYQKSESRHAEAKRDSDDEQRVSEQHIAEVYALHKRIANLERTERECLARLADLKSQHERLGPPPMIFGRQEHEAKQLELSRSMKRCEEEAQDAKGEWSRVDVRLRVAEGESQRASGRATEAATALRSIAAEAEGKRQQYEQQDRRLQSMKSSVNSLEDARRVLRDLEREHLAAEQAEAALNQQRGLCQAGVERARQECHRAELALRAVERELQRVEAEDQKSKAQSYATERQRYADALDQERKAVLFPVAAAAVTSDELYDEIYQDLQVVASQKAARVRELLKVVPEGHDSEVQKVLDESEIFTRQVVELYRSCWVDAGLGALR